MSNSKERVCIHYGKDIQNSDTNRIRINNLTELEANLPSICQSILDILGKRNLEATYQRALKFDLENAGVEVRDEVEIEIIYKGIRVGTRRADLICRTADGAISILELKAVAKLTGENLKQLEYYLTHFKVNTGFLINFPHESGFPDIDCDEFSHVFSQLQLCGESNVVTDRTTRSAACHTGKSCTPEIIRVTKHEKEAEEGPAAVKVKNEKDAAAVINLFNNNADSPIRQISTASAAFPSSSSATTPPAVKFGVTLKGTPCKICIQENRFCKYHKNQAPK